MKSFFKVAGLGLAVGCASVVGASASTLDFTAFGVGVPAPTGRTGTITVGLDTVAWALTTNVGDINYNQGYDGPPPASPAHDAGLALVNDGIGISDDELTIDASDSIYEVLTLTFSQSVRITGFHFLDLFLQSGSPSTPVGERAHIAWNATSTSFLASEVVGSNGGYHFGDAMDIGIYTTALTFTVDADNDNQGYADYALAAVDVAPIPLPAGGLLLLGALGGLSLARRRKSRKT